MSPRGWLWFLAWVVAGAFLVVALVDALGSGPGVFLLPVALALAALIGVKGRSWPEGLGGITGLGLLGILVAYFNRNYVACPESGKVQIMRPHDPPTAPCGGVPPLPWLLAGIILLIAGIASYALVVRVSSRAGEDAQDVTPP